MKKALAAAVVTAALLVPASTASAATPAAAQPQSVSAVTTVGASPMIFGGVGQCSYGHRLLGKFFQTMHTGVENFILSAGLRQFTEPIDRGLVHPMLWSPIEKVTCTKIDDPVMMNGGHQ